MKKSLLLLCLFSTLISSSLFAFPDIERIGVSGSDPPFNFGFTDTLTGFLLKDDETMIASYGETLTIVDLAYYELAAEQPPPLSVDIGTDGRLASIAYSKDRDRVYAPQDDGDCLIYDLANITADPATVVVAAGKELGPIALDNNAQRAYIINTADNSINVLNLSNLTVESVIALTIPSITSFLINAAVHNVLTDEIYFTTDVGVVFFMAAGGTAATIITIDSTHVANLPAIGVTPNGSFVYVVDETENKLVKIDASTHAIVNDAIDLTENPGPTGIVITEVSRPQEGGGNATYAYVAGSGGLSVVNTAGDLVLDMGTDPAINHEPLPMSVTPHLAVASTVTDGYVYTDNATQSVSVISANPWVTVTSLTYSGGGDSLGQHESITIVFQADEAGTATIRSGGGVSGDGTALVDDTGASSWDVAAADTDASVTINYDDNSAAFIEGANTVFVFVTNAEGDVGRIATTVNVDTPPPLVTIESAGFGTSRIYVTFDRMDVADMNHYNVYVDTDPAAVMTKSEIAAAPAQADSGSTQEAEVSDLENGIVYYIAMEAVDEAGNISAARTNTFADGTVAFAVPQRTAGPCELSGESGCSLAPICKRGDGGIFWILICALFILVSSRVRCKRTWRSHHFNGIASSSALCGLLAMTAIVIILLFSISAHAKEPTPQWWSFEAKTGFWMPKNQNVKHFFGNCCNLITRLQGGLLVHGRYGAEAGVGFFIKDGTAVGTLTGEDSRDSFNFLIIPIETNFVWRIDYWTWDYVLPYIKAGLDYWFFRENLQGDVTKGIKYGAHGVLGMQINLKAIDPDGIKSLDDDFGINDLFVTLEAQYQFINSFGSTGLDLSGPVFSIGFLFEF